MWCHKSPSAEVVGRRGRWHFQSDDTEGKHIDHEGCLNKALQDLAKVKSVTDKELGLSVVRCRLIRSEEQFDSLRYDRGLDSFILPDTY